MSGPYVESCHILQNGHWKSLPSTIHNAARGLPLIRPLSARSLMESVGARGGAVVAAAADAGVLGEAAGELVDSRRAASAPRQPSAARESTAKTLWDANMSVFEKEVAIRPGTEADA